MIKGYHLRRPDAIPLAAGGLFLLAAALSANPVVDILFASPFLGLGVRLFFMHWRTVTCRFLKTTGGDRIGILRNKDHDTILGELKRRWAERFKKLFGAVNKANEPAKELAEFQWLRKNNVISEEELNHIQAQLQMDGGEEPVPVLSLN